MRIPSDWTGLAFLDDVASAGGTTWVVGGAVRDLVLANLSKDVDVVVGGIDADRLETVLARTGRVSFVGRSFGVFKWTPPDGPTLDVAMPRTERSTGQGHRDFEIVASPDVTIETDLSRRDFTINAIAVRLPDGDVVDPQDGIADLDARLLRAVGAPLDRFREDPLRVLRGAGFASRLQLELEPDTLAGMIETAPLVDSVSAERIGTELVKLLALSPAPSRGLRLMVEVGLMERLIPEFMPSVGFDQHSPFHHLSLDEHVYAVVDEAARRGGDVVVRTAAFLHDVAKPETLTLETLPDGTEVGHFYGHERRSAEIARNILERLAFRSVDGFPKDGIDDVFTLIDHHLVPAEAFATERSLRRWVRRVGGQDNARRLLVLRDADRAAHAAGLDEDEAAEFRRRVEALGDVPLSQHRLALSGSDIAEGFGLRGPAIGALKEALLERVVAGDVPNDRDALLEAAREMLDGSD